MVLGDIRGYSPGESSAIRRSAPSARRAGRVQPRGRHRLATDPELKGFFAGHSADSLKRIRQLVVDQLCAATGGPCVYIGREMKASHAGLGITEKNWQTSVSHLVATLDMFKVPVKEKDEVLAATGGE